MMFHLLRYCGIYKKLLSSLSLIIYLTFFTTTAFSQTVENNYAETLSPNRSTIEQDTKQILNRPEFRHLTQERQITTEMPFDWDELFKGQNQQTTSNIGSIFSGWFGNFLLILSYACLVCVCCLILYLLFEAITGRKIRKQPTDSAPAQQLEGEMAFEQITSPAENEASVYLQRAQEFAQSGDYHNAIIQLLYGSMSFIERSGWIRFRKGLTYRDYLRAARPHGLPGDSIRQIIRTYEPLGFGRREATRELFERSLNSYEAAFQKKA